MDGLIMNPVTKKHLAALARNPPQAVLLAGETGVGLRTIALSWAGIISPIQGGFEFLEPNEKGTITIEIIRSLYKSTRTRQENVKTVVIDDADAMGLDAQNAFLKLLEEPNSSTRFVLTSHYTGKLLPTIISRLSPVNIRPVSDKQSVEFLDSHGLEQARLKTQILFLASGLPAEIIRLSRDETYRNEKLELASIAKQFVTGTRLDQLQIIPKLTDRETALQTIDLALKMMKARLVGEPSNQIADKIETLLDVSESLKQNGHVRTQLMRLAV